MGKLKIASQDPDADVAVTLSLERPEAIYIAGDEIVGTVSLQASHAFDCDGIRLLLKSKERARGHQRRAFEWLKVNIQEENELAGECSYDGGTISIPFRFTLNPKLVPSFTTELPSVGDCNQVKVIYYYTLSATLSLRNSRKFKAKADVVVLRNPDVVWSGAIPSASLDDGIIHDVGSPLSKCCCWRRGGVTSISVTLHNRIVDIESGIVHVRVLVLNRSSLVVNAARLCLVVEMTLHPERAADQELEGDAPAHRGADLLHATEYKSTRIEPGASAHLNLEMGIRQVSSALLTSQETLLEPSMRSEYLQIDYVVRVEVCHANAGSTVSLDLPLVLVPLASDVLPPLETNPLSPICGRESMQSTEHEDEHDLPRVNTSPTDIRVDMATPVGVPTQ